MPNNAPHRLFMLPAAQPHDAAVDAYLATQAGPLGALAQTWFAALRACGPDVCECLHDGHPTACIGAAAFAYVNVFRAHVNLGFFHGAALPDASNLLQGSGKNMRHIKLSPERICEAQAVRQLIAAAYADLQQRLHENRCAAHST